jgi:hypothetical protein
MTRTATRVAAAVGATVVMMGLATPALACTSTEAGGSRSAAVSSFEAKNDPGKAFHGNRWSSLTLAELQAKLDAKIADKLAWLDAIQAKVSASDRLSIEQKSAFLAHLQAKEDALTQLRADIAAATSIEGLKATLKAAEPALFGLGGWNHGRHVGDRHHDGRFGDRHHSGGVGHEGGQGDGDNNRSGSDQRSGGSNNGGGFHH